MGKKKGNKKGGYDDDIWADDLLQDPIEAATEAAEANEDTANDGLMGMISRAKNKKNKKKAAAPAASFAALADDMDDAPLSDENEELEIEPESMDDDAAVSHMASKKNKKKNKKKSGASTPLPLEEDDELDVPGSPASHDLDEEPKVVIKSAKQKEREKKERAKQLKKQKAAEAKAKKDAELAELEKSLGVASIDENDGDAGGDSKKAKNKKKKKGKKGGGDDDEEGKGEAAGAGEADKSAGKKEKKKSKKGPPIAALQKMIEEQRRAEEELKRREEEERIRQEEEERLFAEEEARIEAEIEAKKQADKERREQLKREGKLLTKKQKEAKARQEQQLKALLASGVQVAGLSGAKGNDGKQGAGSSRHNNRREAEERKRRAEERKRKEEEERKRKEEEEALKKKSQNEEDGDDDDGEDDWEALLESSEDEEEAEAKSEAKSGKDKKAAEESDDDDDDDEDEDSDDSGSDSDSSDEEMTAAERQVYERKQAAAARRQKRMDDAMAARSADNLRSPICCILGHVDTGKCFGLNTPLILADGTTRLVQHIKEYDLLMGDDCTPRQVAPGSLVHESGELFRINMDARNGAESFVCNDEHILVLVNMEKPWIETKSCDDGTTRYIAMESVICSDNRPHAHTIGEFDTMAEAESALPEWSPVVWEVPVTGYLASDSKARKNWLMYMPSEGVEYPADAVKPVSLYLRDAFGTTSSSQELEQLVCWWIGLWIASGNDSQSATRISSTSANGPIVSKMLDLSARLGVNTVQEERVGGGFDGDKMHQYKFGSRFTALLDSLDLIKNKHIPDALMRSTKSNRMALVAGMVDGAGSLCEGEQWEMVLASSTVAADAKKVIRSIGLCAVNLDEQAQAISIKGAAMAEVSTWVQCENKQTMGAASKGEWSKYSYATSSFSVSGLGRGEYYGFTVNGPNERFLLGDFTVTHNTKLLDKIRQTNVQEGEAGGITQQIGATYFPADAIIQKTASVNASGKLDIKVPGLLIIDTPGHESFTNLRTRGSSLCNIAILVVDIMHGLEPQTLESLRLLRDRKTPFIVALNKIDRMYDWKPIPNGPFRQSLKAQPAHSQREFAERANKTIVEFAEQGLNAKLYYENKNFAKYVSLVPTSAMSGEGIPDLLALLVSLTQNRMSNQLMYLSELECTVLEVKVIEGLGTTIDVVLSNGVLHEGDRIVVCGLDGPIVTNVRALLTPQPMRELRVKSAYVHHKSIKAAMGVKITAPGLEKAIAGSRLLVVGPDDDEEELMDEIMADLTSLQDAVDKSGRGVWVQASTLGSLEALLEFLRVSKIPVAGINIGPVYKKDVTRASAMLEKAKEFAVMLCFDVKVDKDAQDLADDLGVKVFKADIIYHLFDAFTAYNAEMVEQKRKDQAPQAIFPCVIKMIKGAAFNKRDPLILGVDVIDGQLRQGTPVCVSKTDPETGKREIINLGKVSSMEINHKQVEVVRKGEAGAGVAVRIDCPSYDTPKMYGRHFTDDDEIYSRITRGSIDILKTSFRNDLTKDEWGLIIRLKKILDIN